MDETFFESQVRSINPKSPLKPETFGNQVAKEPNTSTLDTFILPIVSRQETLAELYTNQLEIWKAIILQKPFKIHRFMLIAKPLWD